MKYIESTRRWLSDTARHRRGVRIVQIAVAFLILFRVFTESPFARYLWGPSGIAQGSSRYVFGATVGGWLDQLFATEMGVFAVLASMTIGAVLLIAGRLTRVATLVSLIAFWALEMRFPELADGGDNVTRLVLFFLLFTMPARREARAGSLEVWLHNVGVLAIGAQVITIYLTSGFLKAYGDAWHNGTALYLVSQVEWFSLPSTRGLLSIPIVTAAASYATVAFQVWFPIAVFTRFRLIWLAAGISLHLGIAVVMGLITFSTVMCSLELFLVTDDEWSRLAARVRAFGDRLAAHPRLGAGRTGQLVRWLLPQSETQGGVADALDAETHGAVPAAIQE